MQIKCNFFYVFSKNISFSNKRSIIFLYICSAKKWDEAKNIVLQLAKYKHKIWKKNWRQNTIWNS